jgi:hypothetical protein
MYSGSADHNVIIDLMDKSQLVRLVYTIKASLITVGILHG